MNQTVIRFVEAFIAVFVVALAADPLFSGGDLGADFLPALVTAVISAALLAIRRVLATQAAP